MKNTIIYMLLVFIFISCNNNSDNITDPNQANNVTDYSNLDYWAFISEGSSESADIVYFHPTTFYDELTDDNHNWEIDPNSETGDIVKATVLGQASIFSDISNIFVPYYQQMNLGMLGKKNNEKEFQIAYQDVKAAFIYYFENFNNGRPFFIMGHSQGANLALQLIEELFSDSKYMDKLIAAYLVGWPITQSTLDKYTHIKVLTSPTQTGGIVAWDVVSENVSMILPTLSPNSIMVNPLTWTTTTDFVSEENNLGAVFFGLQGKDYLPISITPEFTGCQIKNMPAIPGFIKTEYTALVTPDLTEKFIAAGEDLGNYAPYGNYHVQAVNLFYENIRQNAIERKEAFLSN